MAARLGAGSMSDGELRMIFLHELAHYAGGDAWLSLLTAVTAAAHFLNPLSPAVRRAVAEDCEVLADASVLATRENGAEYSRLLIDFAERAGAQTVRSVALPFLRGKPRSSLKRRVETMMNKKENVKTVRVLALCLAVLLLAGHAALLSACTASAKSAEPVEIAEPVLAAAFLALAAGCSTIESRIEENRSYFDSLPAADQAQIRIGKIEFCDRVLPTRANVEYRAPSKKTEK